MIPSTKEQLIQYCLRELGHPVIEINVDEDQLDDRVDQALAFFHDFHYDGTEKYYLKHQIKADDITNQYVTIDEDIIGVTRIFPLGLGKMNTGNIFDMNYQMRLADIQNMGGSSGGTMNISNYFVSKTNMEFIDQILNGTTPIRFNRHTDKLHIDWDWNTVTEGMWIIAECFLKLDTSYYPDVFSDRMLKTYLTALIKKQWGNNLSKFNGIQLPGGVTLDGQRILAEAIQEIKDIELSIRLEYEQPPVFITG